MLNIIISLLSFALSANASEDINYKELFGKSDGCFVLKDIKSGRVIQSYNEERCAKRFPPCSTFKPIVALLGFEEGVIKKVDSVIKWDGKIHSRSALNKDQTPKSWMENSVNWANEKVIKEMGGYDTVQKYLKKINYGNGDFSKGEEASTIADASLKISPAEQVDLLQNIWMSKLPLKSHSQELTKQILLVDQNKNLKHYGKTGSCCIDKGCDTGPGRQLGWYIGVIESKDKTFAYATNFSDLESSQGYAGGKARDISREILKALKIINE